MSRIASTSRCLSGHATNMGTHNHRLQLGNRVYLEIVALDPGCASPGRARWFGLDNQETVRSDWSQGRRLRGSSTDAINAVVSTHRAIFGDEVPLPAANPAFAFSIPEDGSLPLDGAVPAYRPSRWPYFDGRNSRYGCAPPVADS